MTKPKITPGISVGNILTIIGMIGVFAAAWFAMSIETKNNTDKLDDLEARMRAVEAAFQSGKAQDAATARQLDRIERQQDENNRMIRQLLAQLGKQ